MSSQSNRGNKSSTYSPTRLSWEREFAKLQELQRAEGGESALILVDEIFDTQLQAWVRTQKENFAEDRLEKGKYQKLCSVLGIGFFCE